MPDPREVLLRKSVVAVSALLGVSALAVLIAVTEIEDADSLSSIALFVATFAFFAQLLIAWAQFVSQQESERRASTILSETKTALAQVEANTSATRELVKEQHTWLLRKVVNELVPQMVRELSSEDLSPDEVDARVEEVAAMEFERLELVHAPVYESGQRVAHAKFGLGEIRGVEPYSDGDSVVTIKFDDDSSRRFSARVADLVALPDEDPTVDD